MTLIFDADDTLWENNIYFERAFERARKGIGRRVPNGTVTIEGAVTT